MDTEKEYGIHNTKGTIHYPTKKKYGVHIANRTVYHLINVLIEDTEKEYGSTTLIARFTI